MSNVPVLNLIPGHIAGVHLDLEKLIITKLLIQANSGGGKSYAIRYLLEQTYGRVQHIVIDREGEFSTLRTIKPYLLVGRDGDVAADIGTAKLLARKVLELGLSTVVDLSEMSPGQQRAYVRVFIDSLNHAPRSLWKDCIIVIDEAHIFAPESGKGSSEATESIALLLSTGRKRGFCPVLATQRLAKLNKDVAAECLNKLIGRTSNEDIKRAGEELAQGKQSSIQLRGLDPGHFWAYGPAIAPEPVLVRTGRVQTSPPARGADRTAPPEAPEKIRAALAKELAELPKQAADEANSVDALRRVNIDLTRQLAAAQRTQPEPRVEYVQDTQAIAEMQRYVESVREIERKILADARIKAETLLTHAATIRELHETMVRQEWWEPMPAIDKALANQRVEYARTRIEMPPRHHKEPDLLQRAARDVARERVDGELPKGAVKMLQVLARRPTTPLTRSQLGTLSGFSSAGGTFGEYLRQLKRGGYAGEENGNVFLTDAGYSKAGGAQPPQSNEAIWQQWCNAVGAGPRKMLEVLREIHPRGMSRERLGSESGYTAAGGTFGEYLRQLKRNRLVEEGGGNVRLVDELAP